MARDLELEVANFVCRFTDTLMLVDLLDEVVLPAFFSDSRRTYAQTDYFFTTPRFEYLNKSDPASLALTCRFIKDTVLKRHQYYTPEDGIVPDEQSLQSAPSAIAALLLANHRLLYVREVPSAPSLTQFGSTFRYFMRNAVMAYRSSLFEQGRQSGERPTKKKLAEQVPVPDISVVPVVSSESLKDFVDRFETLSAVKIEIAPTNNELDNGPLFAKLRDSKKQVGAAKTVVMHKNPEGLNKTGIVKHLEAAKQGNALVEMRGTDKQGDELTGNNEHFSVRANLGMAEAPIEQTTRAAFGKYEELVGNQVIDLGKPEKPVVDKVVAAYRRLKRERPDG